MSGDQDVARDHQRQHAEEELEEAAAVAYEETHVHGVYEAIAPHFSATRHKPWPMVSNFLRAQPPGAVGLDVGCGNGKYLAVNPHVVLLGSDRSASLISLARRQFVHDGGAAAAQAAAEGVDVGGGGRPEKGSGTDVMVADGLALPFRDEAVDFVICIAVIHHLSTRERRVDAIRQLLKHVRRKQQQQQGARGAITAGQADDADASVDASKDDVDRRGASRAGSGSGSGQVLVFVWALEQGTSRRGWDEGGEQDLLVPWVMKQQGQQRQKKMQKQKQASRNGDEDKSGEPPPDHQQHPSHTDKTYQRYYHLYRKGELEEDVIAAGGEVLSAGYERDNWWVIAGRI
ncbi:putative trna (uracil-5-)-methyltransferase trm9 protein [Phaeoacremonium minimum UCRPA7]|uniref:Putative trna (Uracil-5-)-methyltransferase trm9 protein n=1 Tax=Phaeoacremonium minimum (strain UCR-PA7) TaxID=1286976 RepID=R8BKZ6_PHAM7|nr:putative trna (uracil-5-)-methyltransferase trm9 protein [Phaeoacremonium minimum UCRPA7]EOO00081.1 putative trna (uracil-5-)-methyltransferase trm9 protein [Phaeoacremonium minimum UCRPA7]